MRHIAEAAKTTPVMHETEVLVVGGGPGGLAAALAAARAGAQTTLVDRYGCFGGVITQVGVDTIAWYRHEGTVDLEGIGIEFERRAEEMGGTAPDVQSRSQALDSELFKVVADRLVEEAGVEPLLHCLVDRADRRGRTREGRDHGEQVRQAGDPGAARGGRHRRRRPRLPRRRSLPRAPARLGDGRHRDVLLLRRRQGALPRPRRRERAHLRRLGQVLERQDGGQGGPPLQPLPAGAVRPGPPRRPHPRGDPEHRRHLGPRHRRRRGDLAQHGRHGRLRLHGRARSDARRDRGAPPGAARHRGAATVHARLRAGAPAHASAPRWARATRARSSAATS